MKPSRDALQDTHSISADNDLGRLMRWSFRDLLRAELSPDVWSKILARIREVKLSARVQSWARRSLLPVAPFVQAAVISVLLLAFGLELDRNASTWQDMRQTHSTPAIQRRRTAPDQPEDVLCGYMLARMARKAPPRGMGFIPEGATLK